MATGDRRVRSAELRERAQRLQSTTEQWFLVRCLRRYVAIRGTDRALVIGGQCFTAIVPLLIVVVTLTSSAGGETIAANISSRFHLTGSAAEAVETLFGRPPGAQSAITVGVILLIASGLSLSRSLQRTRAAAWGLPPRGLRGTVHGLAALAILLSQIMLLSLLAGLLRGVPAGRDHGRPPGGGGDVDVAGIAVRPADAGGMAPADTQARSSPAWGRAVTAASAVWMPHLIDDTSVMA